jgi:hypothetical protein
MFGKLVQSVKDGNVDAVRTIYAELKSKGQNLNQRDDVSEYLYLYLYLQLTYCMLCSLCCCADLFYKVVVVWLPCMLQMVHVEMI